MPRSPRIASALPICFLAVASVSSGCGRDRRPSVSTLHAAEVEASTTNSGAAYRHVRGELAIYIPAELAIREGRFDVIFHFHGAAKVQEENVDEARLHAPVVSANVGAGSAPYARSFGAPDSLDRLVQFAESQMEASGRAPGARASRIALSAWSAGGAAVREILSRDGERIDAAIIADGLFSTYANPKTKEVRPEPLAPIVAFARSALQGDKMFYLTHTSIPTPSTPDVAECTDLLLTQLDLTKGPPANAGQSPAREGASREGVDRGGAPTYSVERGNLHVFGSTGKGPEDHVAQAKALDQAYALLRARWRD